MLFSNSTGKSLSEARLFEELGENMLHCVLRALKTCRSCSRRQTYVFQSKIAQGIQKWDQNNQLSLLPSNVFFKIQFSAPKIIKKNVRFVDFWIFMVIYMDKVDQFIENNCRNFRISWNITKMLKTNQFFHVWLFFFKSGVFLLL